MLKAMILMFVCALVALFLIVAASGIITTIDSANNMIGRTLNVTPVHKYEDAATSVFSTAAIIAVGLAFAGLLFVYMIHIRKR